MIHRTNPENQSWPPLSTRRAMSLISPMLRPLFLFPARRPRSFSPAGGNKAGSDASGRGAYVPVPLALRDSEQVIQDPWVLIPPLFDPAYIGGRTAAEHWDLTEQIFRDILVYTARPVRQKSIESQSALFSLKHVEEDLIFGIKTVWRGQTRLLVSNIHRTVVDMLDDPATGGGIQHVADCFAQYMRRKDSEPRLLIDYADRLGNGAVFKTPWLSR